MKRWRLSLGLLAILATVACHHDASTLSTDDLQSVSTFGVGEDGASLESHAVFLGDAYNTRAPASQKYYFAFDSSQLYPAYQPSLLAQAHYLHDHPNARVRLEGNTDTLGSREYNIALGERRALSVAQFLRMKGVKAQQIVVLSFGRERPVAFGTDESARRLNRRVDLIYERE